MDGIFFYWFAWAGWVYCTFIMKRSRHRTLFSISILLILISHGMVITSGNISLNLSFILVFIGSYLFLLKMPFKQMLYYVFGAFIVAMAFDSMLLFSMYDPVWLVVEVKWMLAGCLFILSLLLFRDSAYRPFALAAGCCQGDLVYRIIIKNLTSAIELGGPVLMDVVSITLALCFIGKGIQQFSQFLIKETGSGKMQRKISR